MLAFSNAVKCDFSIVSNNKEMVKKFIPDIGLNLYDVRHSFKKRHFDIAIVDLPDISIKEKKVLRSLSDLIVCIDDEGQGLSCQDVLIRPNLLNLPQSTKIKISPNNYWSGSDYIILHPGFAAQVSQKKNSCKKVKELLVCFGGSDPAGLTLRVIPLLKKLEKGIKVHIVLGASFSRGKDVILALKNEPGFSVSHNVSDMVKDFRRADAALISGGTLLYEVCSLAIPSIVISQNKSQEQEAKICHEVGAAVSLGIHNKVSNRKILAALQRVIKDDLIKKNMVRKGPKLVSPNGSMLIVSKLLSILEGKPAQ
jgi:spore coat polysaccharide biosynthesis predicted glycosyltransferase SpsG